VIGVKIDVHHLTAPLSASEFRFLLPLHPSTFHIPDPHSAASCYTAFSSSLVKGSKNKQKENRILHSMTHDTKIRSLCRHPRGQP